MKNFRLKAGFSVSEAAQNSGVPVSTYREWENGRQIKGEPYAKIAQALNVTLYELLTGEHPKSSEALRKVDEIELLCKDIRKNLQSLID